MTSQPSSRKASTQAAPTKPLAPAMSTVLVMSLLGKEAAAPPPASCSSPGRACARSGLNLRLSVRCCLSSTERRSGFPISWFHSTSSGRPDTSTCRNREVAGVDSNPSLRRARFPRSDRSAGQGSSPASGDDAAQPRLRADGQLGDGERHRERPHGVERGPPRRGGRPARGVGRGAGRLAEREFPRLVAVRCHDPRQRGLEDERTRGDGGLARGAPVRLAPLPAARPRPTLGRSALLLSGLGLPRGDDASLRPAGWSVGSGHLSLLPQQARDAGCDPRPHHGRPHPAQLCSEGSRSRPCRALHAPGRVPSAVPHPIATRWGSSGRARYAA